MKRILFLISIITVLFTVNLQAQSTTNPDTVCAGSNVYYKIANPTANSTFTWGIYGSNGTISTTSQSDSIRIEWDNSAGIDSLWVFEQNAAGCTGDTAKLKVVRVIAPTAVFDNATLCYGSTLNINFTGHQPYNVQYTLDGNSVTKNGITQNTYSLDGTAGTYQLVQVTDKFCTNNALSGQTSAVIGAPLNSLQIVHD